MKVVRITDTQAERLDSITEKVAAEMGMHKLTREQLVGVLLEEGIRAREEEGGEDLQAETA